MSAIRSSKDLKKLVADFIAVKKAADAGAPSDPDNTGTVTIPVQPDAENPKAIGVPASGANKPDAKPSDSVITAGNQPAPSGSGTVPACENGTAADTAATGSLATATSKSANLLKRLGDLQARSKQAQANLGTGATAATPDTAKQAAAPAIAAQQPTPAQGDELMKQAAAAFQNIGEIVAGTAEGRQLVENILIKQAGEVQAVQMLKEAAVAADVYAQAGRLYEEEAQKQAAVDAAMQEHFEKLPPAKQASLVKLAKLAQHDAQSFEHADDHYWYTKGAAAMEAGMEAAMPPGGAGGEPDMDNMQLPGGEGGQPPIEELMGIIEMLVQSGKLTPEDAQALVQEIMGGAGGAPPEGGMPPEAGGAPPADIPPAEAEKAASARKALGL